MSVPERYQEQQGLVVGINNESDWTQTILGVDPNSEVPMLPMTVSVGTGSQAVEGSYNGQTKWILPASIPPHSSRVIRVLWTSNVCQVPRGDVGFTGVSLRVRVGLFTRTEDIQFVAAFVMTGTKASSHCP